MSKVIKEPSKPSAAYLGANDGRPTVTVRVHEGFTETLEDSYQGDGGAYDYYNHTYTRYGGVSVSPGGTTPVRKPITAGDTVYVVLARYSSGDTFGNYENLTAVVGVEVDADDAELLKLTAEATTKDDWTFDFNGWSYYCGTWKGYFERLNNYFIEEVTVR